MCTTRLICLITTNSNTHVHSEESKVLAALVCPNDTGISALVDWNVVYRPFLSVAFHEAQTLYYENRKKLSVVVILTIFAFPQTRDGGGANCE